ncbi:hypothetical protein BG011_003337 [Mortierella polycephala]|uniref:Rab-GAP TBC domain-containing protein n=1 Tax=Mortierella polycephala TaxID=41804 RepID=A0A9P6Q2G2_9FUNG|nr:hypothetical protein BG011_003337 [Mortierella polycephala]
MALNGIAQGYARCNVRGESDQDLMFFAGEHVVLLERLGSGLCMGVCEGVVGRFREQDVDFDPPTTSSEAEVEGPLPTTSPSLTPSLSPMPMPSPSPSTPLSKTVETTALSQLLHPSNPSPPACPPPSDPQPLLLPQSSTPTTAPSLRPVHVQANTRSGKSSTLNKKRAQAPASLSNITPKQCSLPITLSASARHALASSLALDPLKAGEATAASTAVSQRLGPRKLLSAENLKNMAAASSNSPRRLILSLPPAPSMVLPPPPAQSSPSQKPLTPLQLQSTGTPYLPAAATPPLWPSQLMPPNSIYPKGVLRHKHSAGLLSPVTTLRTSSSVDLNNGSSASITMTMLGIKSNVFNQQDHQQPRRVPAPVNPIYQLSTPSSSCASLSTISRPVSPVSVTSTTMSAAQTISSVRSERAVISMTTSTAETSSKSIISFSQPASPTKEEPEQQQQQQQQNSQSPPPPPPPPPPKKRRLRRPTLLRTNKDSLSSSSSSLKSPSCDGPLPQRHQPHPTQDHKPSMLDDLRFKTHNVLRKAGFSIAPDAGLFADRESKKEVDLKVVRMSPPLSATLDGAQKQLPSPRDEQRANEPVTGSTDTKDKSKEKEKEKTKEGGKSTGLFGRPRSRSVKENRPVLLDSQPPLPSAASSIGFSTASQLSTSSSSTSSFSARFDRIRQWSVSDRGHHRSNSGPARHSDVSSQQSMSDPRHAVPLPPLPPLPPQVAVEGRESNVAENHALEGRRKKKGHQRRMSEATTLTVASTRSAGGYPQRFQIQQQQHQHSGMGHQYPERQQHQLRSAVGSWFGKGMGKRRSYHSIEESDPRKPHVLGNGIEGGMDSRPTSMLFLDCEEYDEDLFDDTDVEEEEQNDHHHRRLQSGATEAGELPVVMEIAVEKKPQVLVNDYGFIYDVKDEEHQVLKQDQAQTGSLVGDMAAKLDSAFLAEHERKRVQKKLHEYNRMSEAKWIHAVTQLQPEQVKKSNKYKKLARGGVPTSVRGRVWQFLANVDRYKEPGVFQDLLTRGHIPIHDVIARDIHRCYPDHVHFRDGMEGTGQEDLHSILKAYAHYKPSVGYCQGMGRLVGMMLMQMSVEEAFWLLVATIEGYLNEYFTPTLRQLRIDALVFERLLKAQDPRLATHLERNDVLPIMYMTQWFLTLFTMSLPWASVLRVWDVFYFDGVKTLFRVGLAVLQICRTHLLEQCPSSSECMDYLLHVPLQLLGPEILLEKTAYRIRLRRENIEKMTALTAGEMDAREGGSGITSSSVGGQTTGMSDIEEKDTDSNKIPEVLEETESIASRSEVSTLLRRQASGESSPTASSPAHSNIDTDSTTAITTVTMDTETGNTTPTESIQEVVLDSIDLISTKNCNHNTGEAKAIELETESTMTDSLSMPVQNNNTHTCNDSSEKESPTLSSRQDHVQAQPQLQPSPQQKYTPLRSLKLSTSSSALVLKMTTEEKTLPSPVSSIPSKSITISPLPPLRPAIAAPSAPSQGSGFLFKLRKRAGTLHK